MKTDPMGEGEYPNLKIIRKPWVGGAIVGISSKRCKLSCYHIVANRSNKHAKGDAPLDIFALIISCIILMLLKIMSRLHQTPLGTHVHCFASPVTIYCHISPQS